MSIKDVISGDVNQGRLAVFWASFGKRYWSRGVDSFSEFPGFSFGFVYSGIGSCINDYLLWF